MRFHKHALRLSAAVLLGLAVLAGAAACSDDDEKGTDNYTGATAVSGGNQSSGSASGATVGDDGKITINATDNAYDPKSFTVKGKQKVTVTLVNKGQALHNFALVGQKGPDGKEIQTALIPGGQTTMVEFDIPPGAYEFYCTVHPAEMRGRMTYQ